MRNTLNACQVLSDNFSTVVNVEFLVLSSGNFGLNYQFIQYLLYILIGIDITNLFKFTFLFLKIDTTINNYTLSLLVCAARLADALGLTSGALAHMD